MGVFLKALADLLEGGFKFSVIGFVANNVARPGTAWNSAGVIYSIREIENMSSVKKEQPDDFFDPSKLSESTLRKYQVPQPCTQSYFKI